MPRQEARSSGSASPPVATEEEGGQSGCRHHWVIEPSTGPVSQGACQLCGEVNGFKNYVESRSWGDTLHLAQGSDVETVPGGRRRGRPRGQ